MSKLKLKKVRVNIIRIVLSERKCKKEITRQVQRDSFWNFPQRLCKNVCKFLVGAKVQISILNNIPQFSKVQRMKDDIYSKPYQDIFPKRNKLDLILLQNFINILPHENLEPAIDY